MGKYSQIFDGLKDDFEEQHALEGTSKRDIEAHWSKLEDFCIKYTDINSTPITKRILRPQELISKDKRVFTEPEVIGVIDKLTKLTNLINAAKKESLFLIGSTPMGKAVESTNINRYYNKIAQSVLWRIENFLREDSPILDEYKSKLEALLKIAKEFQNISEEAKNQWKGKY